MRLLICFFLPFAFHSFAGVMEDTGPTPPKGYLQIKDGIPEEGVLLIKRFLPQKPVIVEAGAYDGKESVMLSSHFSEGKIFCFEPVKFLYKKVLFNTARIRNIQSFNLALGSFTGEGEIYLSKVSEEVSMSSSLLKPKEHLHYCSWVDFSGIEKINIVTLDDWANKYKIKKIDVLWLDMQGAELAALKASPNMFSTVSAIVIELEFVEAYKGQPLYHEVKNWLEEKGFQLIAGNFTFPKDPLQWFGDGVFVRKELLKNTEFDENI